MFAQPNPTLTKSKGRRHEQSQDHTPMQKWLEEPSKEQPWCHINARSTAAWNRGQKEGSQYRQEGSSADVIMELSGNEPSSKL